jgi:asparagine synthase (glutamine-hydrolysing)
MTAIVAVAGPGGVPHRLAAARGALRAMRGRGGPGEAVVHGDSFAVGATWDEWEGEPTGAPAVADDGEVVVAADATLYYRDDLRRALAAAGVARPPRTAAECVLAAYHAWGEAAPARLEGDFAFVLYDRRSGRVLAARDFAGKRPLHWAECRGALVVASTAAAVATHPAWTGGLDVAVVAATAAGLAGATPRTAYAGVSSLGAGGTLARGPDGRVRTWRHWEPPTIAPTDERSFDDAAAELRALLARAADERLPERESASVWMSGGWDSTAAFAAGQAVRQRRAAAPPLLPVSVSYPPGDPGREDELIAAVAEHWGVPVRWVDIAGVPLFDRPADGAAARDGPFAHAYEHWARALARGSRAVGARVAFDGVGGDQLFQVSQVYLADLLRAGRWRVLADEWRAKGLRGRRAFFTWAVRPLLPTWGVAALARVLGQPLPHYLERTPPPWVRPAALGAEAAGAPSAAGAAPHGQAAREMYWYLTNPYFPFVFGTLAALAREEGVELRSPLYDARIIAFAARRPRAERSSGTETKRLLRHAMRDLLPGPVLAPRARRTGVTAGYFRREMMHGFPQLAEEALRSPVLGELGIVDVAALRAAVGRYVRTGDDQLGVQLFFTLQTELWLRSRAEGGRRDRATDGLARVGESDRVYI